MYDDLFEALDGDSVLVRRKVCRINIAPRGATPTWIYLRGVNNWGETGEAGEVENATFDGGGHTRKTKTTFDYGLDLGIDRITTFVEDANSEWVEAYDEAQEFCRAKGPLFGVPGQATIQWFEMGDGPRVEAYEARVNVGYKPGGGAVGDVEKANITFSPAGPRKTIEHPFPHGSTGGGGSTPPSGSGMTVTSVNPDTGLTGGDIVTITGTGFADYSGGSSLYVENTPGSGSFELVQTTYVSDTTRTFVAPARSAGAVVEFSYEDSDGIVKKTGTLTYA